MKVVNVLWGLLVDDGRLASILCVGLLVAVGLRLAHQPTLAAVAVWLGLVASLWVSIEHQLKLKRQAPHG